MTMAHYALEITLTRSLTAAELHHAARTMPLAANHDATRLMTVVRAKTPGKALTRLRRRIGTRLPIDVITTHYLDRSGKILLNVAFPRAAHTALAAAADRAAQTPQRFLELALHRALAQHASDEANRLDRALQQLLAHTTPAHLVAAVGHALTRTSGAAPC
ncbi:hypothetical protein ACIQCR_32480 [Streptomyces sp. NPDC093249]|uniref:hypothetical protein n=1 Tax=unclassified Streptomyces TaxID=2593676 RepID=UPI0037FB59C1